MFVFFNSLLYYSSWHKLYKAVRNGCFFVFTDIGNKKIPCTTCTRHPEMKMEN